MEPIPRKPFVECPRCRGAEVRVPWEPGMARGRRRAALGLALLWATSVVWVSLVAVTGKPLWAVMLLVYGLVTVAVAIVTYRNARLYHCTHCHLRWPV